MNALQIAAKVAVHPFVTKLRTQQDAMRRQMVRDYGDNFMSTEGQMTMNGRKTPRYEGVHFWTVAQRREWFEVESALRSARKTLRNRYAAV